MSLPHRSLGKSGVKVAVPGFGAMGMSEFYGPTDEAENLKVMQKAIDLGCTFWDTADVYGQGKNEELIAKVLKTQRDKIFLCTKFGNVRSADGAWTGVNGKADYVKSCCEASLKRLGTSYIDLYYQHRVDKDTPIEETAQALKELQAEGKIKYIGLSECSAKTLRAANKIVHIDALQVEYSPFTLDIEENGLLQACRELGTAIIPYSPLGRGMISGQIKTPEDFAADDFRKYMPRFQGENFKRNLELVSEFEKIATKKGCTPSQLCLAWVMAQGDDFIPIPGTKKEKYLIENVGAAKIQLSPQDLTDIRAKINAIEVQGLRYPEAHMKNVNI